MRVAYLGPPGTNSHAALVAAAPQAEPVALPSIAAAVAAVQDGSVERALVPLENSRQGAVAATLDALVFDAPDVAIVGEVVHPVTYCLAAAALLALDRVGTVHSHPQALAQCAGFLRERLPAAALLAAPSTAEAVRAVAAGDGALAGAAPHAAIGTSTAAALYGATVLASAIEDERGNATRFAWLARAGRDTEAIAGTSASAHDGDGAPDADPAGSGRAADGGRHKTALVFWGDGDVQPGWLVACLTQFSSREINLTRIESRPQRIGLGHYMFFCDLQGAAASPDVAAAIAGLRSCCETVRMLGSYSVAG